MGCFCKRLLWAGLFVGCGVMAASPAAYGQGGAGTVLHLHGTVVDGVTNRPIGRALVTSIDGRMGTMTDHEGHFHVDLSVPAMSPEQGQQRRFISVTGQGGDGTQMMLLAKRPGYLERGPGASVALDAALDSKEVFLKLMPVAAIRGRVSAEGVDAARNVQVQLLKHQVQEGELTWTQAGAQQTQGDGTFQFGDLQPGEYTVMTAEWTGDEPFVMQGNKTSVQYPPDFVGDVRTLSAAGKLHLRYGGAEQVELHLRRATYYPIRVPVANRPANGGVSVVVLDEQRPNGYALGWNQQDGAVEGALPSGKYTLIVSGYGQQQQSSARMPLVVGNGPVLHAPVTLAEGVRIPVRVHLDFTADNNGYPSGYGYAGPPGGMPTQVSPVQINLQALGGGTGGASSTRKNDQSEAVLEGVQPGVFTVQATSIRGYIASMSSGGVDLLQHPLTVGDGGSADAIDVTLRNDNGKVDGTVDFGSEAGLQYCVVFLLPTDGSARVVQGYAQGDGKIQVDRVPPGSYRVLAVNANEAQMVPYRNAEAMRVLEGKGTTVTVRAGGTETVHVAVTPMSEMEGGRP